LPRRERKRSQVSQKRRELGHPHKLPENCSLEDIQYHLYVFDKVRRGLDDTRAHGTISQEEAEKRLSKWLGRI